MQNQPQNHRKSRHRRLRWGRLIVMALGVGMAAFGLVRLIGYGLDLRASRRTSAELGDVYHAIFTSVPADPTDEPAATALPATAQVSAEVSETPLPVQSPVPYLRTSGYPDNPGKKISSRFRQLQKESRYIVGWLSCEHLIDEPVVQRNNEFFLDHDARGKTNVNGAVFLDSGISLKTRPYTYILYGHNMKSGAMFGSLRNFEKASFYHSSPLISFDTMYEEGRYVIFAVGNVSTEERDRNYVDFYELASSEIAGRQRAIDALMASSVHTCTVDVQADDQLLILVTCVEKDEERRVVAARRIRDGEDENELKKIVGKSRKR